jgi:Trk K+ transport system NAD-binding subunit
VTFSLAGQRIRRDQKPDPIALDPRVEELAVDAPAAPLQARGSTILEPEDEVLVLCEAEDARGVRELFGGQSG